MKFALIGAGQRGMIYAEYAFVKKNVEIVAVVWKNAFLIAIPKLP